MKKLLALVLVLCLTLMANVGSASEGMELFMMTDWYQATVDKYIALDNEQSGPAFDIALPGNAKKAEHGIYNGLEWNKKMLNNNFPYEKLRDVTKKYNEFKELSIVPMNCLGLGPNGGNNLRSTPDYSSNANIIGTMHGNETFYLYFSVTNFYNVEWYYVVTASGLEGFLAASRVQAFL